jgi:hypothetical protein
MAIGGKFPWPDTPYGYSNHFSAEELQHQITAVKHAKEILAGASWSEAILVHCRACVRTLRMVQSNVSPLNTHWNLSRKWYDAIAESVEPPVTGPGSLLGFPVVTESIGINRLIARQRPSELPELWKVNLDLGTTVVVFAEGMYTTYPKDANPW